MRVTAAPARVTACLAFAAGLIALPGCGGGEGATTTSRPAETIEPSPRLPEGWAEHINRDAGFSIGVPPLWTAKARGTRSELGSPERLAAVTVTIDRTDEVREVPIDQLATATISAGVPGLSEVEPGEPRPIRHRYEAVKLRATGVGGDENVPEDLQLVVLRRRGIATVTVLAAVNANNHPKFYLDEIDKLIASIRTRPITPG